MVFPVSVIRYKPSDFCWLYKWRMCCEYAHWRWKVNIIRRGGATVV